VSGTELKVVPREAVVVLDGARSVVRRRDGRRSTHRGRGCDRARCRRYDDVGIGVGLFLFALGAILTFALGDDSFGNVNVDTVGIILMIVGVVGLLLSLLFWSSVAPFRRDERTVIRDREREVL
jgi:hypothetical protein